MTLLVPTAKPYPYNPIVRQRPFARSRPSALPPLLFPSLVSNVIGLAQAAEMLGPLLAGMVAFPRLPLGRVVGPVLWRTPRHQVFGRQPSKVLGGLAGMLTQPLHPICSRHTSDIVRR